MWCSLIAWTHVSVFVTFVYQLVFIPIKPFIHSYQVRHYGWLLIKFSLARGECLTLTLFLGMIPCQYRRKWYIAKKNYDSLACVPAAESSLHRFRDIDFDRSKIAIFGYTTLVFQLPRRRGSPGLISIKFHLDVKGWPRYQMRSLEKLPKISIAWVGLTNVTDDRQTNGRRQA